ncbi:DUF3768 domain-containing protein [Paracoccus sp. J39]|uniref:DUF3768 domain-containing protein n=1 Tax=Paracoccus sp. J39 TaxID=935848 RepID=UPI000490B6A2|nr:DUF3768 domain-containing protein [Paracoccus sp. J39]
MNRAEKIAGLNDELRRNIWLPGPKNRVMLTSGLAADPQLAADAVAAVRAYDTFNKDNDPYQEHDMGFLTIRQTKIFWKIDYFDNDLKYGSEDPSDPEQTTRVLTIMLSSEY